MSAKAKRGFDAVTESRRWKEAVAAETAGMSSGERMAWPRDLTADEITPVQTHPKTRTEVDHPLGAKANVGCMKRDDHVLGVGGMRARTAYSTEQ